MRPACADRCELGLLELEYIWSRNVQTERLKDLIKSQSCTQALPVCQRARHCSLPQHHACIACQQILLHSLWQDSERLSSPSGRGLAAPGRCDCSSCSVSRRRHSARAQATTGQAHMPRSFTRSRVPGGHLPRHLTCSQDGCRLVRPHPTASAYPAMRLTMMAREAGSPLIS